VIRGEKNHMIADREVRKRQVTWKERKTVGGRSPAFSVRTGGLLNGRGVGEGGGGSTLTKGEEEEKIPKRRKEHSTNPNDDGRGNSIPYS